MPAIDAPGVTNSALYTDSTLAIDPDSGALKWAFQHFPNDQWDLDYAFERQLIRLPVFGAQRTVAVTAGKLGIYEGVDAETGEFVFAFDVGLQNIVTAIDPETGAKAINQELIPKRDGKVRLVCPHGAGVKSFLPASYNAATQILIAPLAEACMDVFPIPGGGEQRGALSSGGNWGIRPVPGGDGKIGRLEAIDLGKRKPCGPFASVRRKPPACSRPRAGSCSRRRSIGTFALQRRPTGAKLWEQRLNDVSSSSPITFRLDGNRYVAIVTRQGGFHAGSFAPLVPDLKSPPDRGAAVWVFALGN